MGWAVFPTSSLVWGQSMVGATAVMVTTFKRTFYSIPQLPGLLRSVPLTPRQATVDPWLRCGLSDARRQVWDSLLRGHCSLLLVPGAHRVHAPTVFPPVLWKFCNQIPLAFKQIPWGFSASLLDPQVGKSVVGPKHSVVVQELLWYDCSAVCSSSAWWLFCRTNGKLLQEDLCGTPGLPGLLQPEPLSPRQVTADPCLRRKHSNTQSLVGPGVHSILLASTEHLWQVWDLILNATVPLLPSCWGSSFASYINIYHTDYLKRSTNLSFVTFFFFYFPHFSWFLSFWAFQMTPFSLLRKLVIFTFLSISLTFLSHWSRVYNVFLTNPNPFSSNDIPLPEQHNL